MTLPEKIDQYIEHVQDAEYIEAILTAGPLDNLYAVLAEMVRTRAKTPDYVTLFIRDMMLLPLPEFVQPFRENFLASPVVEALRETLSAPSFFVRHDTVYTIGKLCLKDLLGDLYSTFNRSLNHDPLLLPG